MILLSIFLSAVFGIFILIDLNKLNKKINCEKKKIAIVNELLELKRRTDSKAFKAIKISPVLEEYLSQADYILNNYAYRIDEIKVYYFSRKYKKENDIINLENNLRVSYKRASKSVRREVDELARILEVIYELQHPYKYRWINFKKKCELQILKILLKLCSILIKILEIAQATSQKKKERSKKIENLQIKTKDAQISSPFFSNDLVNNCSEVLA
jgi:hypothetical protein